MRLMGKGKENGFFLTSRRRFAHVTSECGIPTHFQAALQASVSQTGRSGANDLVVCLRMRGRHGRAEEQTSIRFYS